MMRVRQVAEKIADEFGRRDLLRFGARSFNTTNPPFVLGEPTVPSGRQPQRLT